MMPLFSTLFSVAGTILVISILLSSFLKVLNGDGDPREMVNGLIGSLVIGVLTFGLPSLFEGSIKGTEGNTTSSSPFNSLPLKAIGIGLSVTIVAITASFIAWHFSKSWRDKRSSEKGHQKVMREIWHLRSRIAEGAFDEQGLDILNALAYVEDSLITFKIYRAEATQVEQLSLLKEIKPKLNDIITRFGSSWKGTVIENALKNISILSK